ncbi:hypothetical protein [Modestobacter roseus]|uniref:Uncharacterized protein n=1 Tax=Modestobacter roseus TaxID=1181884 RepID=A0A562IWT8_9ACTN|nr:hypothetical protein [Modestobacter roseus]MQA36261.1 hypothetical protein [Modestobacter roseus]TWH75352.1 hypothetical protein JD78_03908 [Modestobacter roseus]
MATGDWVTDESLSAEETMRRFESLGPVETAGPPAVPPTKAWGARLTLTNVTVGERSVSMGQGDGLTVKP